VDAAAAEEEEAATMIEVAGVVLQLAAQDKRLSVRSGKTSLT